MDTIKQIIAKNNLETVEVLRLLSIAHRKLGELKGVCQAIQNQAILINTLILQEARDSSEIENIITTQDEIFKHLLNPEANKNIAAKEVQHYGEAANYLFEESRKNNLITINMIISAQEIIKRSKEGIRKRQGTQLMNEATRKIVYIPPEPTDLQPLLTDLEHFMNNDQGADQGALDPIIKMAIIHHQFESIHPFYDGNGRMGRIINIIYLVKTGLLDSPVLYLSRYINHNKSQYYQLLQSVRDNNEWNEWLLFIINGVIATAQSAIDLIDKIIDLQQEYKIRIRTDYPKIYSQDLVNNVFRHPYTKIAFLQQDLQVSRTTATRYLGILVKAKLLTKHKLGRESYYLNNKLVNELNKSAMSMKHGK